MVPGQVPMDRKPGTWTGSHGQETWYLDTVDRFPFTGDMIPGQVPWSGNMVPGQDNGSRHGTQTSSHGKEAGYLDISNGKSSIVEERILRFVLVP